MGQTLARCLPPEASCDGEGPSCPPQQRQGSRRVHCFRVELETSRNRRSQCVTGGGARGRVQAIPRNPPTFPPAESDHQGTVCHCQGSLSSRRELNPSPTLACARKSVKNTVFEVDLGARCEPPMLAVAVCMMPVGCPDDKILIAWAEWASSPGGRVPPPHTWETKHCVSAVGSAVCARP